jgi:hypothetical protein
MIDMTKLAKRLLCAVLAAGMLTGLAIPSNAAKPTFSKQPGTPGTVMCNQRFTLSAAAKNATSYRWTVEYGSNFAKRKLDRTQTMTTYVRERDFPLLDVRQLCYYRCEASNADGTVKSATASVVAWLNPAQAFVHGLMVLPNYITNLPRTNFGDITAYSNLLAMLLPVLYPMALPMLIPIAPIYLPLKSIWAMVTGKFNK